MTSDNIALLCRRLLEMDPTRLCSIGLQVLISNPLTLSVLMAWLINKREYVQDAVSPASKTLRPGDFPTIDSSASSEQFQTFVSKVLTVDNTLWANKQLAGLLKSPNFDSLFARFVAVCPTMIDYIAQRLYSQSANLHKAGGKKFAYPTFALIQHLYRKLDIGKLSMNTRLTAIQGNSHANFFSFRADQSVLAAVHHTITEKSIADIMLRACDISVARLAEYIPSHLWFGRRLFFPGSLYSRDEGVVIPCLDGSESRRKVPPIKYLRIGATQFDPDCDLFLMWSDKPPVE